MAVILTPSSSPFEKLEKIKWGKVLLCEAKIGEGSYAKVYDLKWNGTLYAGKKFKPSMSITTLGREIQHWSSMRHPNVVLLCGVTFKEEDKSKPMLVMERMDISLSRHLKDTARSNQEYTLLPFVTKVSILSQVAKALAHIHFKKLLHGDLTANNVLLSNVNSGSVVAKVSDFGMSRSASETVSTATLGSLCYLPPEVDDDPPDVSQKVDVFSFGVLAIHCITHKCPKRLPASKKAESGLQLRTEVERFSHVLKEFRTEDEQLLPLIDRCVRNDPSRRPEADTVCKEVASLEESIRKSASESPGPCKSTSAPVVNYSSSISLSGCNMDSSTLNLLGASCPASQPPSEPDQNEVERANIPAIGSEQSITRSREEPTRLNEGNLGRFSSISGGHSDHQLSPISNSDPSVPAPHGAVASGSQKRGPTALLTETATPKPLPDPLKFEYLKTDPRNPLSQPYCSYIPMYEFHSCFSIRVVEFENSLYFYQGYQNVYRINRRSKSGQLIPIVFPPSFTCSFSVAATADPPAIHVVGVPLKARFSRPTEFKTLTLDLSRSAANTEFKENWITPLPVPECFQTALPFGPEMLETIGLGSLLIVGVVCQQQFILMGIDLSQRLPQWTLLSQFTLPHTVPTQYSSFYGQLLQYNSNLLITYKQNAKMVPLEDVRRAVMTNSAINDDMWQLVLQIPTECGKLIVYRGHLLCVGGYKSNIGIITKSDFESPVLPKCNFFKENGEMFQGAMVKMLPRVTNDVTNYRRHGEEYQPQEAVYVYNPDSYDPEWKYVGCLNTPRIGPALFVKDDRLYVAGGQCNTVTEMKLGQNLIGDYRWCKLDGNILPADEISVINVETKGKARARQRNDHVSGLSAKRCTKCASRSPSLSLLV